MREKTFVAKKIALNGILGALAVISLLFATILPTNRLALYALSSFFISVSIIESGIGAGWLFYAATSLLAVVTVPDKIGIIPYVIFFGVYGIVKYYIEKINKIIVEYFLKIAYFNLCLIIAVYFIKQLFFNNISLKLPWWLIIVALELVFIVYDLVYTMFVAYYRDKLKKIFRI